MRKNRLYDMNQEESWLFKNGILIMVYYYPYIAG